MMQRNCDRVCRGGLLVLLATSLLAAFPAAGAPLLPDGAMQAADEMISAKLHPALLERVAVEGEPVKAWVFFGDKGLGSAAALRAAIDDVAATYNVRAIERRRLRGANAARGGALFDMHDVPVANAYVLAVEATGAQLHVTSSWLNAISVRATRAQLERIATLPFVDRLEAVARARRIQPLDVQEIGPGPFPSNAGLRSIDYGASTGQLNQINLIALHDEGYTGDGVIVGILDTGFRRTHVAFNQPGHVVDVIAEYDFVDNDPDAGIEPGDPSNQHNHGTLILGCLGAYMPGSLVGGAYNASFVLAKTEDTTGEYPAEEDNYVAGLQFIEANGADMATSSLGYIDWYTQAQLDGQTAVTTIAVNLMTGRGVHHCNAAGNEYHDSNPSTSSLIAPSDGFQVITCGAVSSTGGIASFSSDGPTADGRVKPEVLAQGLSTSTVSPSSDTSYTTASGTSLSTPLVACAVACLVEAHPDWTPDELRNMLFKTADYYVQYQTHDPLYIRGYGIVNAYAASQDCNDNGIPDPEELAGGAQDCQPNGLLDECEIADGTVEDCNENDIPDECDVRLPPPAVADDLPAVHGWVEISVTGTPLSTMTDDGVLTVTMPFVNSLFTTDQVRVGNNGGLGFGGSPTLAHDNQPIPNADAFGGTQALFALWDDIDSDTGGVCWQVLGTEPDRTLVVEWYDRPHFRGNTLLDGDEVTFQVQVFETPVGYVYAQMLYLDTDFQDPAYDNGASASIGYQGGAAEGFQWSYNEASVDPSSVLSLLVSGEPTSQDNNHNGVPDECEFVVGDVDCDMFVDYGDINPFVLALINPARYALEYPDCDRMRADCNGDQEVDFGDINAFVALVTR